LGGDDTVSPPVCMVNPVGDVFDIRRYPLEPRGRRGKKGRLTALVILLRRGLDAFAEDKAFTSDQSMSVLWYPRHCYCCGGGQMKHTALEELHTPCPSPLVALPSALSRPCLVQQSTSLLAQQSPSALVQQSSP